MTDTATQAGKIQPRLKTKYRTEIAKTLTEERGYTNVHQVPGLVKIVVNMGVGEAARDGKIIDGAIADLTKITGQKPQVTKARKSIAQFKLREGQPIGAHVTLRGDHRQERRRGPRAAQAARLPVPVERIRQLNRLGATVPTTTTGRRPWNGRRNLVNDRNHPS